MQPIPSIVKPFLPLFGAIVYLRLSCFLPLWYSTSTHLLLMHEDGIDHISPITTQPTQELNREITLSGRSEPQTD